MRIYSYFLLLLVACLKKRLFLVAPSGVYSERSDCLAKPAKTSRDWTK